MATAQREVLSHQRLRRTTCLTNWLARRPMQSGRLARVERVRLATRYIPTSGGLAARPQPSELPRAARSNPNPDVSSSGRPVSLPSPTLPPPLLPSPPPPSLPQSVLRWPSPPPLPLALLLLPPPPHVTSGLLAPLALSLTLAAQPNPRGIPSPSPSPRPQLNADRCWCMRSELWCLCLR